MSDTEAAVVADLAVKAATPATVSEGTGWRSVAMPPGFTIATDDETKRLPTPQRSTGTIKVHDGASFTAAVKQRSTGTVPVYVDDETKALTALLNDDSAAGGPGWRDYRVALTLRKTPEWTAWCHLNDDFLPQALFAEMIEERVSYIVYPAGAVMLDLAQSIEGSVNATFKSGSRLQSGARQVTWVEDIKASGGTSGTVDIPEKFTFAVPLFFGGSPVTVTALLRYRIDHGHLELGYKIVDAERIELETFTAEVNTVLADDVFHVLRGPAPENSR